MKVRFNVWIGIGGYKAGEQVLALGVWTTNRMWRSDAERTKWAKKLKDLGLKWDTDDKENGFMKVLKTELKSSESDPNLLRNIVQEVQEVIDKVCDRL